MTETIDADGDATAVFQRERPRLTRLAHAITGSNALADDIVQDAYLRFRGRTDVDNPPAFLRTVVVNLSRDALRRRSVAERVRHERPVALSTPDLDETWSIVRSLPERYRTALALRFYEDLPEAQIAELMGCRLGTVKSLIHRGLDKVRKELER